MPSFIFMVVGQVKRFQGIRELIGLARYSKHIYSRTFQPRVMAVVGKLTL